MNPSLSPAVADPLALEPEVAAKRRSTGLWRDTLGNVLRQRSAVVGLLILGLLVFTAIFAEQIATHDPTESLLGVEKASIRRGGQSSSSAKIASGVTVAGVPVGKLSSVKRAELDRALRFALDIAY